MRTAGKVLAALLGVALLAGVAGLGLLWHQGYRPYVVRTGSMTPTYPAGTLIIDAPVTSPIVPGDVITFRSDGHSAGLTTHRVVRVRGDHYATQGDANATIDAGAVAGDAVVGRAIADIPRGGYLMVFLQQPSGVLAFMAVTTCLLLLRRLFFPPPARGPAAVGRHRRPGEPVNHPVGLGARGAWPWEDEPILRPTAR